MAQAKVKIYCYLQQQKVNVKNIRLFRDYWCLQTQTELICDIFFMFGSIRHHVTS